MIKVEISNLARFSGTLRRCSHDSQVLSHYIYRKKSLESAGLYKDHFDVTRGWISHSNLHSQPSLVWTQNIFYSGLVFSSFLFPSKSSRFATFSPNKFLLLYLCSDISRSITIISILTSRLTETRLRPYCLYMTDHKLHWKSSLLILFSLTSDRKVLNNRHCHLILFPYFFGIM